jgi:HD-like signal output (HDOD) protein
VLRALWRRLSGSTKAHDAGSRASDKPSDPVRVAAPAVAGVQPTDASLQQQTALHPLQQSADRLFTARLLGVGGLRPGEAGPAERLVIQRLTALGREADAPNLVPRLPVVLPRLLGLVRRDDVSPRELVERLSDDPTLVGEVVRVANSPRYRIARDVEDLHEAVLMLGQRGLVQIVVSAAMRPIFDMRQGRFSRIAGVTPWDLTQRCSHACADLCDQDADRFQAFLSGMGANVGLIAALRVLDSIYAEQQVPDTEGFHDALSTAASRLSGRIARQWGFTRAVCQAIERRGDPQAGMSEDRFTRTLSVADRISKWHVLNPGLPAASLTGLSEPDRRCYLELERAFGS